MRILHLATSTKGGAGIAARRLHESLLRAGERSYLLSLKPDESIEHSLSFQRSSLSKFLSSLLTFLQAKIFQKSDQLVTPIGLDYSNKISKIINSFDVVHIHAFYNLINSASIISLCEKYPEINFLLTLHDERFTTGGCHYSANCVNKFGYCNRCPQTTFLAQHKVSRDMKLKVNRLPIVSNLRIIAPSEWMLNNSVNSPATAFLPTVKLYNPIPEIFFQERVLTATNNYVKIIFIAATLNTRMKGLNVLVQALNKLIAEDDSLNLELRLIGMGDAPIELDSRINATVTITSTDEETFDEIRSGSLLVVPSIQDNLPSTMIEGLCSGIPVIGSRTGGIAEVLDIFNQRTFITGDSLDLARKIRETIDNPIFPDRELAKSEFSYENVARKIMSVYRASSPRFDGSSPSDQ